MRWENYSKAIFLQKRNQDVSFKEYLLMFLSVGGCLGKFLLDFLAAAPIIALHCLYRVGALQKMLNTDDAISVFRSLRSQEKYTFIKSTVFILGNFIGTFVGTTVVVTIKLTHQLISKADWRAIDSLKKQADEFVLFAFLLFTANKSNSSVRFLGESTARQSAF